MKGLITLGVIILVACVFQESQAQSTWSFKTEEPKQVQTDYRPEDLFTVQGLVNSGLDSLGKEPEKRTTRFDFSFQMQLPANK